MDKRKYIIYIGEFDMRNQNVQAHLVKNNSKILNRLGYVVQFIGVNRAVTSFEEIELLPSISVEDNPYLELPNTLNIRGFVNYNKVCAKIFECVTNLSKNNKISYIISYQSPTFATIIKRIGQFCRYNAIPYIVNSADIPIFDSQPLFKRQIMQYNWHLLHKFNQRYANGVIAVSRYIDGFYKKEDRPSVVIPPLFNETIDQNYVLSEIPTFVYAGTPFIDTQKEVNVKGMKDRLDKIIDLLICLKKTNTKFRCVIVGITKEKYCCNVPRHAKQLMDADNIIFKGRMSHNDTLHEVKNADYMINYRDVNPMTEAGMSTKVVESVSLGTPVIMNSIGDTFIYLKDGVTGYKLSGDTEADSAMLRQLCNISESDRYESKRKCANNKTFSIDSYVDTFKEFFQKIKI